MRAVNIIALVVVFIMGGVALYFMEEVGMARWAGFDFGGFGGSNYYGPNEHDLTIEGCIYMLIFILFFTFAYIGNLVKIKTMSTKVMSIIGLSFTLIILLIDFGTIADPGSLSFDESGGFFIAYGIINLAFFIVLLVQSIMIAKQVEIPFQDAQIIDQEIA